jgi:hypothetical protein
MRLLLCSLGAQENRIGIGNMIAYHNVRSVLYGGLVIEIMVM